METEGNKVLAEFMGDYYFQIWKKKELGGYKAYVSDIYPTIEECLKGIDDIFVDGELNGIKYYMAQYKHEYEPKMITKDYNSWDDIMPVWIKFRETPNQSRKHKEMNLRLAVKLASANSPSDFFPHLVEAVKWYNQTKTK